MGGSYLTLKLIKIKMLLRRSISYLNKLHATQGSLVPVCTQYNDLTCRNISTGQSKKSTVTLPNTEDFLHEKEETKRKNWISYGFHFDDEKEDRGKMHRIFFGLISIGICVGGLLVAYSPDMTLRDWAQREAFIELRRREREGLPLIDANFVPVDQIELPTEEELGNTPIII